MWGLRPVALKVSPLRPFLIPVVPDKEILELGHGDRGFGLRGEAKEAGVPHIGLGGPASCRRGCPGRPPRSSVLPSGR